LRLTLGYELKSRAFNRLNIIDFDSSIHRPSGQRRPSGHKLENLVRIAFLFSNAMWYWKPEQPPTTTATRSATGTGLCIRMISLTLVSQRAFKLIIKPLASAQRAHPPSYYLQENQTSRTALHPVSVMKPPDQRVSTSGAPSLHTMHDQTQSYSVPAGYRPEVAAADPRILEATVYDRIGRVAGRRTALRQGEGSVNQWRSIRAQIA